MMPEWSKGNDLRSFELCSHGFKPRSWQISNFRSWHHRLQLFGRSKFNTSLPQICMGWQLGRRGTLRARRFSGGGVVTTHSVNGSSIPRDPGLRTSPKIGDARFRSVLGACGMHGALGAGRRRRRSRAMGGFLRAAVQAFGCWTRCSVTPAGRKVARIAVRPPGRVPELARCAGLVLACWPAACVA